MQVAIDIRDEYYEDFEKNRVYISKLVEEYLNNEKIKEKNNKISLFENFEKIVAEDDNLLKRLAK